MKDLTITAIIKVYQYDELNEGDRSLIKTAMEATARSYSPYSHFSVGAAALLGNGTVVTGTNQENAAYPSGLCAERTTLFYANSQYPDQPVVTLAIAARTEKDFIDHPIPPCGACRQVILETERDTTDLKMTEYMVPFVGEPFDAHITGLTRFGQRDVSQAGKTGQRLCDGRWK